MLGCLGVGCGLPLLALLFVGILYIVNNQPPAIVVPTPLMPRINAYDDFVRVGQAVKAIKHKSPYSMPLPPQQARTFANFAACARDAAPALAVLRQALSKPYQAPPERSFYTIGFPVYATFREIARTLAGVAKYYELSGQPGRAADTLLDGMEMGVMIPRGAGLMAYLVGIAIENICLSRFEPLLPKLSPADLAHVTARLDRIAAKRVAYADIVLEEARIEIAGHLEEMRKSKGLKERFEEARSLIQFEEGKPSTWSEWGQAARYVLADKAAILRENQAYYEAVAAEARKPYTGPSRVPIPNNLLAQIGMGTVVTARTLFVVQEAITALLQTEVALYRYRAAHRRYPDRLAQLVPAYLKTVPDDPFGGGAGRPLRYKVTNNGRSFLLYSLGPDLRDDGGIPKRVPTSPGDVVAGRLWSSTKFLP